MPRGNRMGPNGLGPMSGRAQGFCAGADLPGNAGRVPVRGLGQGREYRGCGHWGGFREWCSRFYAAGRPGWMPFRRYAAPAQSLAEPVMEKKALQSRVEALQSELEFIRKELRKFEKEPETGGENK